MGVKEPNFIRNPLTVIAIFAGLAETGGTAVLPFLAQETQIQYIWFLMLFPVFLVLMFFATLWLKHHVLYAPSDFKDENIFARSLKPAPDELIREKLVSDVSITDETIKLKSLEVASVKRITNKNRTSSGVVTRALYRNAKLSEEFSVKALSQELNVSFLSNVVADESGGRQTILDAVGFDGDREIILEIKYIENKNHALIVTRSAIQYLSVYFISRPQVRRQKIRMFVIIVCGDDSIDPPSLQGELRNSAVPANLPVEFRVFKLSELTDKFGNAEL